MMVDQDKQLYEIDITFTRKEEIQFHMFYSLCKTRIGGGSISSTTRYLLEFYTGKTKQYLQAKVISQVLSL